MARGIERIGVLPPVDSDETIRAIAKVLKRAQGYKTLPGEVRAQVAGLTELLAPWGIREESVRLALSLVQTKGGYARGTKHVPNSRLVYGATNEGIVTEARDTEVYMRAAYLANSAKRIQRDMRAGKTREEALRHEAPYYRAHERARKQRLEAAAQIQVSAKSYGYQDEDGTVWLGWYHNPFLNNDPECLAASGHNFDAAKGTVIGWPGSVHPNCGCYAGPYVAGAGTVNDAVANLIRVRRLKPQFKLKSGRRRPQRRQVS